jgi:EmrB/QacA subfamily drug resistance transporter
VPSLTDRRIVLITTTLASFLTPFMGSSINIALPALGAQFGLDAVALGWISSAFLLASAITMLPAGRIGDIHGRKRVFTLGVSIFGLACLLIPFAPSGSVLIALRVVQGSGAAMMAVTSVAILTSVYPPHERGRVLGINVAAVYLGASIGPTIGGLMTEYFGWRSIFFVCVPLAVAIVLFTIWKVTGEWAEARGDRFDLVGAVIYGLGLLAVMYGFSTLSTPSGMALVAAGLCGLAAFAWWEARSPSPLLDVRIFRQNPVFARSNLAALINYMASSASGFLLSLYLQQIRGLSPDVAGFILVAQPVMQAILSPIAGHRSDRVEPRILVSFGMSLTAAGLLLLSFLTPQTSLGLIFFILMVMGVGFAFFSSPNTNAIMGSVDRRLFGIANATLSTMRTVGMTLSIGITVLIFSVYIGHVQITPQYYPQLMTSIKVAFALFGILCIFGVLISLTRGKVHAAAPVAPLHAGPSGVTDLSQK